MTVELSDAQRRWLLEMVIVGVRPKLGQLKPALRAPMLTAGLIELVPNPDGRGRLVHPTEAGWAWVVDHFDVPFTTTANPKRVWNALAAKLQVYLQQSEDTLASVLAAEPPATEAPSEAPEHVLRRVYLRITEGELKRGVRLARLRQESPLPEPTVDEALHRLRAAQAIVLYPIDDRAAITSDDHAAAITVSGVAKHVIFWER